MKIGDSGPQAPPIGQVKTDEKSNEIKAIPELLDVLALSGCIVTVDAAGCQRDIVAKIVAKEADYMIGLKGNQPTMLEEMALMFDDALKANPDGRFRRRNRVLNLQSSIFSVQAGCTNLNTED